MKDVEIIGMLKSYVQKSLVGVGALKGAPCKIQSITDGDGFHTVKFEWTDDAGTSHTSDMIVNDGSDIASITQDGATITVTLSDGTAHEFIVPTVQGPKGDKGDKGDAGEGLPEGGTAGQVLVKESSTDYDMEWKTLNIPSKTSDLTNDSGFITKVVNDLVNYYLKSETYSKTEVDDIVTAIKNSRFEVVSTLPTTDIQTNVIYLVPKDPAQTSNVKDEYINLDGTTSGWEKIGDTEIDLSGYVTTQALNTALAAYTTTADLTTLLAGKQDTLTFDNAPTENSNNPVKSGGVYAADDKIYQVMGQNSAKNFIPFDLDKIKAKNTTGTWNGNVYSLNGIDFTFNSDGTVDASGTATETASVHYYDPVGLPPFGGDRILRLTGCPSGGSGTTYKVMAYRAGEVDGSTGTAEEYGDGISLRWLNDGSGIRAFVSISVYTGAGTIDLTFKPMLRLSTDTDKTFAPYAKTNQQLTRDKADKVSSATAGNFAGLDANGNLTDSGKKASDFATATNLANYINENGAINQFNITLSNTKSVNTGGTWDGNAFTYRGLTYTVNDDNIVITGTPTDNSFFYLLAKNIPAGKYTFGGLKDSANIIWDGGFWLYNGSVETAISTGAAGNKDDFTVDLSSYTFDRIKFGIKRKFNTLTNDTIKLFIRKADINIDVNAPYTKTNRELTEDVADARILIGSVTQHISVTADGTKTNQTLMQELHSALSSLVASLNTDEVIYILGARSGGGTWFSPSNVELKYSKSSTVGNISMDSFTVTAGENCYHYSLTFSSTLTTNTFRQMTVSQSGNTFVNRTSDVPSANSQLLLTYQIYKTIS